MTIQDLAVEAERLLEGLGEGSMSETAYDTAWVARVPNPDVTGEPLFPAAYDWLLRNQHEDGSWGAEIAFPHDRIISTLAALITLAESDYRRDESEPAARRAIVYLNRERPNLEDDPAETVGFELILPELARQAQALGLHLPYEDWTFVEHIKADKLKRIPPIAVYGGPTPLTHSLEYLGDRLMPSLAARPRSKNGSYGCSPSATAYVQLQVPAEQARAYLERAAAVTRTGGFTYLHPFENFESAWVVDALEPLWPQLPQIGSVVERLGWAWTSMGMAWSTEGEVPDADDTAVSLSLFSKHKQPNHPGSDVFELYEGPDYFQTFVFERNPSVTTNAHILSALRLLPVTPERRRMTLKLVSYLEREQVDGTFWCDKWHASPYYATDRVLVALNGTSAQVVRRAVRWLLDEQGLDGGWGLGGGTVEETAWALDALEAVGERDVALGSVVRPAIDRAADYLTDRFGDSSYPALWIGKGLYSAPKIIRARVIGVLARWDELKRSD
ncbi:MAG: SQHop cyclase protein [Chloroflexi bacterium]|nr:SQHop cyclase protein [Chloroflexota bacterium]